MLIFSSKMVGGLTRLSPLVSTINTKIAPRGGHVATPFILKCMTKEEIIARKNADTVLDGAAYSQAAYGILKKYNPALRNYI